MQPPLRILVVDEVGHDYLLLKEAFDKVVTVELFYLTDEPSAIEYLKSLKTQGSKLPDAIIIDVDMIRLDGIEILKRIKLTPMLFSIPVIMRSSCATERYRCLTLGANAFHCKTSCVKEMSEFVKSVISLAQEAKLSTRN